MIKGQLDRADQYIDRVRQKVAREGSGPLLSGPVKL